MSKTHSDNLDVDVVGGRLVVAGGLNDPVASLGQVESGPLGLARLVVLGLLRLVEERQRLDLPAPHF